jgi:glycosyltransferase involved in cell wall biosynthesis
VRRFPVRRLPFGPPAPPDRILFYSRWFKGHNNAIYAELVPRLDRIDAYLLVFALRRVPRALQFRGWLAIKPFHERLLFARASKRYRGLLATDNEQIPVFDGPVVVGLDDPTFKPAEVARLKLPNVQAYVVTDARAAHRLEQLGVDKPWYEIPLGFSRSALSPERLAAIAGRKRGPVVGYTAAAFVVEGDRSGSHSLYGIDHLIDLWEDIHAAAPEARLWLVGEASTRVRRRLGGRDDVVLFGRLPREEALNTAANFDVALYPRRLDEGIRASKVGEYIGVGVPTVSYDLSVTDELRRTGAGLLVETPREFVEAVVRLVRDPHERGGLAANARTEAERRDWDVLAREWAAVLDRHLPAAPS